MSLSQFWPLPADGSAGAQKTAMDVMTKFTILGASGFIGSHLVEMLRNRGEVVDTPDVRRGIAGGDCGHLIYCIGLTADFRSRPLDTMHAHAGVLAEVLKSCRFESLLYLSSARVYAGGESGAEDAKLRADPATPDDIDILSKMAGEALCLTQPAETIRVARVSNVFGDDLAWLDSKSDEFLPSLIRAALRDRRIRLQSAPASSNDYVWIDDVTRALYRIAVGGKHRLYNVGAGRNISHGDMCGVLRELTGCEVDVAPGAPTIVTPQLDLSRLGAEFGPPDRPWAPVDLLDRLGDMVGAAASTV